MENGKQPINPVILQRVGENEYRAPRNHDPIEHRKAFNGLTKREYFASQAMIGLLTCPDSGKNFETMAKLINGAVQCADELLKQLESK